MRVVLNRWLAVPALVCVAGLPWAGLALAADWPQWGGDPSRNMVSSEKGLPVTAEIPEAPGKAGGKNVKWAARIGTQSYGNPTVAGGRVYLGTNNDPPRDPKYVGDYGILLCLDEQSGEMVWQLASPKLAAGKAHDYEGVGLCSSPAVDVEAGRVYAVTNRCEVICLDVQGQANGNDGPFKDEGQYIAGPGKSPAEIGPTDADIIWVLDMRDAFAANPYQMASSAPLVVGDKLFVTTSNGVDWTGTHVPFPGAPALVCLDKNTGEVLAEERSGISGRTFRCNWSSPAFGEVAGQPTVVFGGGDGFCYGFSPEPAAAGTGDMAPALQELWRLDCNPPEYKVNKKGKAVRYGSSKGPSEVIATPVVYEGRVYAATGQEPESGDGVGCLNCIDPAQAGDGGGDITQTGLVWRYTDIGRSMSTASVADGLLYIADFGGRVHCLDVQTGQPAWVHDMQSPVWGSTLLADGNVYVGNQDGTLVVLAAGRELNVLGQIKLDGPIYSTPVAANGVLYVMTDKTLYALQDENTK